MRDDLCVLTKLLILALTFITSASENFNLTIMHTNDVHARIEEADVYGGPCTDQLSLDGKCFGGVSRIRTKVNEIRKEHPNTLLLDAGDQFQGTLWFYVYGGQVSAELMNLTGYDAMAIGNHEFDRGIKGLYPFAHSLDFPLLASNANLSMTPELADVVNKSIVKHINGRAIGIVGYTTPDVSFLSTPETMTFSDELKAIQDEVDNLVNQSISIIIALGHSGYAKDLGLAKKLKNVDVIVGGHTNTFLYSGNPPSVEIVQGEYPTVVVNEEGHKVLVVQDYAFGKYLGMLEVEFNDTGDAVSWSGDPVLLDKNVTKDEEAEALLEKYMPKIREMKTTVIGQTLVDLSSDRTLCRTKECILGDLVTDAMVHEHLKVIVPEPDTWTDAGIALVNAGGFRSSIPKGNITIENVIFVQPFRNTIVAIQITGKTLLDMLEFMASKWTGNANTAFGGFLQVSGLQITYHMKCPIGKRVMEVLAICTHCPVAKLEPLNPKKEYRILTSTYLVSGGEGYDMLPRDVIRIIPSSNVDTDVLMDYIKSTSPINIKPDGRIRHLKPDAPCGGVGRPLSSFFLNFAFSLLCFLTKMFIL